MEGQEESFRTALFGGELVTGMDGSTIAALPKENVLKLLKQYNRISKSGK